MQENDIFSACFIWNLPYCLKKVSGFIFKFREINLLGGIWFWGDLRENMWWNVCIATRKQEAQISIYALSYSKRTQTLYKWLYVSLIMYYILLVFRIIAFQCSSTKRCDAILIYSFGRVRRITEAIFVDNLKYNPPLRSLNGFTFPWLSIIYLWYLEL